MITQADKLLHPHDQQLVRAAVAAAEGRADVEVVVHAERSSRYPEARANDLMKALRLQRTDPRHCLFVYVAAEDRRCIVVADAAIRPLQGTRVWSDVMNRLTIDLLHGKVGQGLADTITRLSHILAGHFPAGGQRSNGLPRASAARGR
ncbi:MAG: rane protein [Myxococcales bacterium]|nr:rane protein [Myxococcales bacterium]